MNSEKGLKVLTSWMMQFNLFIDAVSSSAKCRLKQPCFSIFLVGLGAFFFVEISVAF